MRVIQMPPVHAANLVAKSGNTTCGVDVIDGVSDSLWWYALSEQWLAGTGCYQYLISMGYWFCIYPHPLDVLVYGLPFWKMDWTSRSEPPLYQVYIHSENEQECFRLCNRFSLWCLGLWTLGWRHNGHDGVSNHQPHHCLLNRLFGCRSKKTSKLRVIGLRAGNSPGTGEFPAQLASNAENVSIWWRHHGWTTCLLCGDPHILPTVGV